jgi:small ligand-binding sensory domain FIST
MRFRTALSPSIDLESACREAIERVQGGGDGAPDLAIVFVSPNTLGDPRRVPELILDRLAPRCLIGCSGGGVIAGGREVEGGPAFGLTAAWLPGALLQAVHVVDEELPSLDAAPSAWVQRLGVDPARARGFVLLPEPFSFAADALIAGLDFAYPQVPKIGGLVSGSQQPGLHVLFCNESCATSGAVLLALSGDVTMATVVAQGCRPFGRPAPITAAELQELVAIEGKPALRFLQEQLESLEPRELARVRGNPVFLGIARDPFAGPAPGRGEFLIRNLLRIDEASGSMTVGDHLGTGRVVQFHVRDRSSSDQDLRGLLARRREAQPGAPAGALMFACLGRGRGLYGDEDHDSRVLHEVLGDVPVTGFFCNGEIGPVGGQTYLHGYTAALGLFHPGPPK